MSVLISVNDYEEYFNENSRLHLSLFHLTYLFKGISCKITHRLACYLARTSEILEGTLGTLGETFCTIALDQHYYI